MSGIVSASFSGLASLEAADVLGGIGVTLYVGSYLALQLGLIRGNGYLYPSLNLVAGAAVLFSLMEMFNPYSALTEIAWITISVIGIVRMFLVQRFLRLSPKEQAAAKALVPSLAQDRARLFVRTGQWRTGQAGEILAREGEPLNALIYLSEGRCGIEYGGVPVAAIGAGGIIGEMTYRTGQAATASVVAESATRRLHFDAVLLRRFLEQNTDIEQALELSIAGDLRGKLTSTTQRLANTLPRPEAPSREPDPPAIPAEMRSAGPAT